MLGAIKNRLGLAWEALVIGGSAAWKVLSTRHLRDNVDPFFEPLTPVIVTDGRSARYERELLHALENSDVLNIALTGSYGAGKSSVLKTFFRNHPQFKHTYVSLATFSKPILGLTPQPSGQPPDPDSAPEGPAVIVGEHSPESVDLVNRIEETIVQQLLYAVPAAKVPKTRLKRIAQDSNLSISMRTLGFTMLVVCALRLYVPKLALIKTVSFEWLIKGLTVLPESAALAGVAIGAVYLLYAGLRFLSLFTIDGLTLKGGKLEATHHGSVLHKNVDEIIYCFERSDINVVIIEDLDRFDIQDIFFRLREINFIIQRSPQVKRPVHFVYAIRDELFTVTDKTKFFDLIIPIIPVINSENSREKLVELMKARQVAGKPLDDGLNLKLIETVCYYIDEMRLIKNIVNEYDVYSNVLAKDGLELNPNKLFAMVAIRNLHPNAYADLVKRRGAIYGVIGGYSKWVKAETDSLETAAQALEAQRAAREDEVAFSVEHLRVSVWFEILKLGNKPAANHVRLDGGPTFTLLEFVSDPVFAQVVACRSVQPMMISHWQDIGQAVLSKKALEKARYDERLERFQTSFDELDEQIEKSRSKVQQLKTAGFRQIVSMGYGSEVSTRLKGLELIVFLVHRGFFDTDYVDYLGYFYEGSLTQSDKNLIMGLIRGEEYDVSSAIHNPELVVRKLDLDSVDGGRGIMVDLIHELLQTRNEEMVARKDKLRLILRSGHDYTERLAEAVASIVIGVHGSALMRAMYGADRDLMHSLLNHDRFKAPTLRQHFLIALLDALTPKEMLTLDDKSGQLRKTINQLRDTSVLAAKLSSNQNGWKWVRELPAQFSNLDASASAADLRHMVEWGCFALNLKMLSLVCHTLDLGTQSDRVTYHRLSKLEITGLDDLIKEDPDGFVAELVSQEGSLEETPESLVALFRLCEGDAYTLQTLLEHTTCIFTGLDKVPNSLWERVMKEGRVRPVGDAAWAFFDRAVMVDKESSDFADVGVSALDTFVEFLENNAQDLADELWGDVSRNAGLQTFLIRAPQVENSTLRTLFSTVVLNPAVVMDIAAPRNRWALFAYGDMVEYREDTRAFIADHAPSYLGIYLTHRWEIAREQLDMTELPVSVALELSKANVCSTAEAIEIWSGIPYEAYDTCEGAVDALARACERATRDGLRFPTCYLSTLLKLLLDSGLSREQRIILLIHALAIGCSWAQTAAVLPLAGEEYQALLKKRRVNFPAHDADRRLIDALSARGFVGAVKPEATRIVVWSKHN